ncbi:hypothetical protein MHYP_G00289210 [Metynnis hypsauchen]
MALQTEIFQRLTSNGDFSEAHFKRRFFRGSLQTECYEKKKWQDGCVSDYTHKSECWSTPYKGSVMAFCRKFSSA